MIGRRRSLLFVLGLSFKRAVLFGIGIAAGSLIALAVFDWGGLAVLGFSNEANQVGYLIIAGAGMLLSFGLLEIKLLYHGWLKPSQESKERTRLQKDRAILETDVANLRNEYANLTTKLTASQQSLRDVRGQLDTSRADLATLANMKAEEKRQTDSLRQTSTAYRQGINSLEAQLGNLHQRQREATDLDAQCCKAESVLEDLRQEQVKVEAVVNQRDVAQAQFEQLKANVSALEQKQEQVKSDIKSLRAVLAKLDNDKLRSKSEFDSLSQQEKQAREKIESLDKDRREIDIELTGLRRERQEASAIIQQRDEAQSQLKQLEQRMSAMQTETSDLQSQIDELDRLIERKKQVETSLGDLYHEVDSLKQELENKSSTIVQVKGELGELLAKPDFMRGAGWQDVEKQLRTELSGLEDRKMAIENRIEHLWNEIQNRQHERIEIDQAISSKAGSTSKAPKRARKPR